MRCAYAHDAILLMAADADTRAPGAAITAELCGHWEHLPPCPLAPHHTRAERVGDRVHLRILFAAEPGAEQVVRERIDTALSRGEQAGPDAVVTRWRVHSSRGGEVTAEEADHAQRLSRS